MIYIVEDDDAIRELEQYALQSNGYEVASFASSEPFWQAMRTEAPELVILDVMLPGEDGFSILKKLRNTPSLHNARHSVTVNNQPVELTYKEYSLLRLLLENTNLVVTRETILQVVWGTDISVESRTVDMHIRTLRKKLGDAGRYIGTIRKVGYKLADDEEAGDE